MNNTVGTIQLILSAQTEALEKGFEKAGEKVEGLKKLVEHLTEAYLSFEGLKRGVEFLMQSAEAVEALGKESEQLGITVESYQALQLAAEATGLSQERFGMETTKLQTLIGGLAVESAKSVAAFDQIGVTWADLAGKGFDEQFGIVADKIHDIGDASARTAAAIAIFGKKSIDILPLLNKGSEGLKEQAENAKALGLAFSDFDVERVRQANEGMNEIKAAAKGIGEQIVIDLAGPFKDFTDWLLASAKDAHGWQDNILPVCEAVAEGFGLAGDAVRAFGGTFHGLMAIGNDLGGAITWVLAEVEHEFVQLGDVAGNFGDAMSKTWDFIQKSAANPVASIEYVFTLLFAKLERLASEWLEYVSNDIAVFNEQLGQQVYASALAIHKSADAMEISARKAFKAIAPDAAQAANAMEHAWDNLLMVPDQAETGLDEMSQWFFQAGKENGQAFLDGWDGTHSFADAIAHSFAEAERKSKDAAAKLARESAAAAANEMKKAPALSAEQMDQFAKNRGMLLSSADSDPRVKHEKEVLSLLSEAGHHRNLEQAQEDAENRAENEAFWNDPSTDPKVAYEEKVAELVNHIQEQQAQFEEDRRQQEKIARAAAVANSLGSVATLASAFAQQSKVLFMVGKAAAIAQAEVNAWITFSATLANASKMGLPLPLAETEAALGFAAAQVAVVNIAQQQPPGRADGGPVSAGGLYRVNERGPELLSVGDKQYLMMGSQSGHVTPNGGAGPGGGKITVNVHNNVGAQVSVSEKTEPDGSRGVNITLDQIGQAVAGMVRTGTGPVPKALEGTYGLNRTRGAR